MKLHFLGTCCGAEPRKDRKHASFALECNGRLYWFDAGEGCSYTAHNLGLDLLAVNRVIISHPHMDHVGGLGNLMWNIRKLYTLKHQTPYHGDLHVYIPNLQTWEGVMMILRNTEGNFEIPYQIHAHEVADGVLFDDGFVRVTAYHNDHIPAVNGKPQAYSFCIECEGKRIVYSGDVHAYEELDAVIGEGCDGLILETGHFKIDQAYQYVSKKQVGKVYFFHCGREFLHFPEESRQKVETLLGTRGVVTFDGMTVQV